MNKLSRKKLASMLVAAHGEKDYSRRVKQVAAHMIATNRAKEIELLIKDVELEASKKLGHVTARVSTAHPLDNSLRSKLNKQIKELTNAKNLEIIEEIDTSLLGGTVIATPEMEVDLSLAGKLRRLKDIKI